MATKRATLHEGEYWYSTHGVDYSISHFVERHPTISGVNPHCKGSLISIIGNGEISSETFLSIPCHTRNKGDDYYQIQTKLFAARLLTYYPEISEGCCAKVTQSFMEIVRIANATHNCMECHPGVTFAATQIVVVKVQPHYQSLEDDRGDRAIGRALRWPATRASVVELLEGSYSATAREDECAICMEEMQPSKGLVMPCSHSFHPACLIPWLDHNHFCPLCRYQLPRAEYRCLM